MTALPSARSRAKHRSLSESARHPRLRRRARALALLSGLSLATTGVVVGGGVLVSSAPSRAESSTLSSAQLSGAVSDARDRDARAAVDQRTERLSRSAERVPASDPVRSRKLSNASGPARTHSVDLSSADPRTLAKALMPQFGMPVSQFSCLDAVWSQESGWNTHAANPTSSAYGIPQALPGSKMSSAGPDWQDNPVTQIKWGLGYIKGRYGSACGAAGFKSSHGWY